MSHPRWPLHAAELLDLDEDLVVAAGLPRPEGTPRVLFSPGVDARVGWLQRRQNSVGFRGAMPRRAS